MKKTIAMILMIAMLFCTVGCGKSENPPAAVAPAENTATPVETSTPQENTAKSTADDTSASVEDIVIGDVPDELRIASERTLIYTTNYISGEGGTPVASAYAEIFTKGENAKYIVAESVTCDPTAFDMNVYSVPREEIESVYTSVQGLGLEANEEPEQFDNIEKYITLPITNLTVEDGYYLDEETGNQVLVLHNSDSPYEAFGSTIGDDYAAFFKAHGLSLKANRVELVSILGESNLADGGTGYAAVKADIGCAENFGDFASLEWIPAVGAAEEVTFIVKFNTFVLNNDGTPIHMFLIGDIAVL